MRSVRAWLDAAGVSEGPIFAPSIGMDASVLRASSSAPALVVQHVAASIGLDAATFAGHSLRAGFATSAARAGKATGLDSPRDSFHRAVPVSEAARCWWT